MWGAHEASRPYDIDIFTQRIDGPCIPCLGGVIEGPCTPPHTLLPHQLQLLHLYIISFLFQLATPLLHTLLPDQPVA